MCLMGGRLYSVSLTGENWKSEERTRDLDRRELEEAYQGWAEGSIAKGMIKVSES